VLVAYTVAVPKTFDFDLVSMIIKIGKAQDSKMNVTHNECAHPKYLTESDNKIGLFVMVIIHLILANLVSKLEAFKVGF
jgi:hypothetical protein